MNANNPPDTPADGQAGRGRQRPTAVIGRVLWQARLMMAVASVACMVLAAGALWVTFVDMAQFASELVGYAGLAGAERGEARTELITKIVKVLDGFLLCAILVIAALGIYGLFVDDGADSSHGRAPRLLEVRDLDDLKERVARLVLLILMIELFGYALKIPYTSPMDLLLLAAAILLVALAIYLTSQRGQTSASATTSGGGDGHDGSRIGDGS